MAVQPFINKTPNYSVGTATATNGSVTVTFTGANLVQTDPTTGIVSSVCTVGDRFNVPGVGSGTIQAIDPGGEQITLAEPWGAAKQTNAAYTIYRYSTPAQGVVLAAANQAVTQGQDSNPVLSETIDDGTARFKLRLRGGAASIAVGPTGTADALLVEGIDISQAGVASFPNGAVPPSDWSNNRFVNSGFDVWQQGTTFSIASAANAIYTADQWLVNNGTNATLTVAQVPAPAGFSGRWAINAQATGVAAGSAVDICHRFEGSALVDLDTTTSIISFDLNASTSAGSLGGMLFILCNSALDNATWNVGGNGSGIPFAIPVGSGRVTVPIRSIDSANVRNGAQIYIRIYQNSGAGNPNITIGAVKWEKGSVASPWSPKPIWQEWLGCQRYYQTGHTRLEAVGTYCGGITRLYPPMRVTPSIAVSDEIGQPGLISTAAQGNGQPLPAGGGLTSGDSNQSIITDCIFATAPGNWVGFRWTASARL